MGKGTELDYCDRCGLSIPHKYLKEKNGLSLCPGCYKEPDFYPESYREFALEYEHDLFERMAKCLKP